MERGAPLSSSGNRVLIEGLISRKSHTEIVAGDELGVLDVNVFEVMGVAERKDLDVLGDEVIVERDVRPDENSAG